MIAEPTARDAARDAAQPAVTPEAVLAKKSRYQVPCSYHFFQKPPVIVRGEGAYLFDAEGKRYLDCVAGVSVMSVGHSHPEVVEAVRRQVGELAHTTSLFLTEPVVNLAERLAAFTPAGLDRSFFCASGSEANEGAALLAHLHSGRSEFLALDRGLHGRTKLGMSLTGLGFWRADGTPVGGIQHAPTPYCYRCPLKLKHPECGLACADEVEKVIQLRTSGKVAAMIVEPVLGNGGLIVPPPGYFQRLAEILERHDILLIADEIQTGFGRTGKRFALEHWGVTPDVMTVAKALGGGLPIAAYLTRDDLAQSFTRPSASTFGGNLISVAAALAVLTILERDRLEENAARVGAHFKERLQHLAERHPCLGDVRGLGLMLGVEVVDAAGHPDPGRVDAILEGMKDAGVLVGKGGAERNVLAFHPPLILTVEQVEVVVEGLGRVLGA